MNRQQFLAVTVAGFALLGGASAGQAETDTLSVIAPPSLQVWSETVLQQFERKVRYPEPIANLPTSEGMVAVKFNCSESGAPADVQLLKTSGHRDLDLATVRAVQRIPTLHPLPRGVGHDQKYIVRILYATSAEHARDQMAKMNRDAARSNGWVSRGGTSTAMLELAPTSG